MGTVRIIRDTTRRDRARALRYNDTDAEAKLWGALRAHRLGGGKWKRQVPRGAYIVDFLCEEGSLVVEVDGGQHADAVAYDLRRTAYLEEMGYRVLRFWNSDVLRNRAGVCGIILDTLGGEHPSARSR